MYRPRPAQTASKAWFSSASPSLFMRISAPKARVALQFTPMPRGGVRLCVCAFSNLQLVFLEIYCQEVICHLAIYFFKYCKQKCFFFHGKDKYHH